MREHSSLFNICGDGKISLIKSIGFVAANALNNARPLWLGRDHEWSVAHSAQREMLEGLSGF